MKTPDAAYYATRLSAELAAAAAASDPHARRVHQKLAEEYRKLLDQLSGTSEAAE